MAGITSAPWQVAGWFLWHFERCVDIVNGSEPKKVVTARFVTALFPYTLVWVSAPVKGVVNSCVYLAAACKVKMSSYFC